MLLPFHRSLLKSVEEELQQRWARPEHPDCPRVSWFAELLTVPTHEPIIVNGRTNLANHTQLMLCNHLWLSGLLAFWTVLGFPSACFTLGCHRDKPVIGAHCRAWLNTHTLSRVLSHKCTCIQVHTQNLLQRSLISILAGNWRNCICTKSYADYGSCASAFFTRPTVTANVIYWRRRSATEQTNTVYVCLGRGNKGL